MCVYVCVCLYAMATLVNVSVFNGLQHEPIADLFPGPSVLLCGVSGDLWVERATR